MAVKTLRVDGMRDDNRDPAERAALEAAEQNRVDLTVDHVLEAARRDTGLDDFGPLDFTDRLRRLLDEVAADVNVWTAHKQNFIDVCVRAAVNRLYIQHYWNTHPDVHQVPIDRPVNVVALPRSGSTHLENLLAADRRLRHLPVYLAAQPAPDPREEGTTPDPRWVRSDARWQGMSRNEIFAAMHEHSPDHACGENELQIPDFASYQWEWLADVPGFRDHYLATDQTPSYLYMREVLKLVAHQFPGSQRWMLKSNQHSEQLNPLLATYPDATVVMIHRDPVATLQSLLTMRGLALKRSQKRFDVDAHVSYWVARLETMLRRYLRDRADVPADQLVELQFADIIRDDVNAAASVLDRAGLPVTDQALGDIRGYMDSHPRGQRGRVVYDLAGDFRLDAEQLRRRFEFYTDTCQIRPEVGK